MYLLFQLRQVERPKVLSEMLPFLNKIFNDSAALVVEQDQKQKLLVKPTKDEISVEKRMIGAWWTKDI